MKKLKQAIRLLVILILLILAAFGIGITGNIFSNRERYVDNEVKTEETDKKEDESDQDARS